MSSIVRGRLSFVCGPSAARDDGTVRCSSNHNSAQQLRAVAYMLSTQRPCQRGSGPAVTRDPKDDYLVAIALAARADAITSGDDELHAAKDLGVEVLTPRELLTCLGL